MKRASASLLLVGLLGSACASAQSVRDYGTEDRYGQAPQYDYARVVRVDPVIGGHYGGTTAQTQCYYRDADDVYARDAYRDDAYGDGYRSDGYRRDPYAGPDTRSVYGERRQGSSETGRTVATVIGGIAGAVLGSKIGDGSGRYVGTAVGSMVGGMAGRSIYEQSQRERQVQRGQVRVCDPVPASGGDYYGDGRVDGYDVTYEYANRTYHTRTNYHPGDRIRVRVDVRPE